MNPRADNPRRCARSILAALLGGALSLTACSGGAPTSPEPAPAAAEPTAHADHAAHEASSQPAAAAALGGGLPPIPPGAKVSFVQPLDGTTVTGALTDGKVAVTIKMAAEGVAVKPAGPVEAGSGHHHVLIDTADIPEGAVIPMDDAHVHFGKGQTETTLSLPPGPHTLTLQLADGIHRSYGPTLAAKVHITVAAE